MGDDLNDIGYGCCSFEVTVEWRNNVNRAVPELCSSSGITSVEVVLQIESIQELYSVLWGFNWKILSEVVTRHTGLKYKKTV
jgi:hypothetical protein